MPVGRTDSQSKPKTKEKESTSSSGPPKNKPKNNANVQQGSSNNANAQQDGGKDRQNNAGAQQGPQKPTQNVSSGNSSSASASGSGQPGGTGQSTSGTTTPAQKTKGNTSDVQSVQAWNGNSGYSSNSTSGKGIGSQGVNSSGGTPTQTSQRQNGGDTFTDSSSSPVNLSGGDSFISGSSTAVTQLDTTGSIDAANQPSEGDTSSPLIGNAYFGLQNGTETTTDLFSNGTLSISAPFAETLSDQVSEGGAETPPNTGLPVGTQVGTMDENGNYVLNRPDISAQKQASIFDHQMLEVDDLEDPLGQSLIDAQRAHAEKNAFGMILPDSAKVDENGQPLDGSGVNVLVYDAGNSHSVGVQQIIDGIAPGANINIMSSKTSNFYPPISPDDTMAQTQIERIVFDIDGMTQDLQSGVEKYRPDVVNMSYGVSKYYWASQLVDAGVDADSGEPVPEMLSKMEKDPLLQKLLDPKATEDEKLKVAHSYIDRLISTSPEIKNAMTKRDEFMRTATEKDGVIFVYAAGNDGMITKRLGLENGEGMELFGKNTIMVGASHPNGTPELKDDTLELWSSTGTPLNRPTIAAPGQTVIVGDGLSLAYNLNGITAGTSFSAPEVAGTIALMLQKNPNLKYEDVKQILTETAVDTDAPPDWEGAGMMDPVAAIKATPPSGEKSTP